MKPNIGFVDRIIRIVIGAGIVAAGYFYHSWWGLIGLLPLVTAVVRVCPAYLPFGFSTCESKSSSPTPPVQSPQ